MVEVSRWSSTPSVLYPKSSMRFLESLALRSPAKKRPSNEVCLVESRVEGLESRI